MLDTETVRSPSILLLKLLRKGRRNPDYYIPDSFQQNQETKIKYINKQN